MSDITTDDCKDFLTEVFPDTVKKQWKRLSKYKNNQHFVVREFSHPIKGNVFIIEDMDEELQIIDKDDDDAQKSTGGLTVSDYIFTVVISDHLGMWACITRKSYWIKNGYINDQPDYYPTRFFPASWEADDINEGGTWVFQGDMTQQELINALNKIGFSRSDEFDIFIGGKSI